MNKKKGLFLALVALATLSALSACGSKNNANNVSPSPSAPAPSGTTAAGGTQEITLHAKNWVFDQTEIKVKKGDAVKVTLVNDEGAHGLAIEDFGVNIKNGQTAEFTADKTGTFEYHCSIQCGQGHDNMTGNLIVE
ncbi:cytochrome C oxidase subunit II [Cohnella endophytica]|uniref:Cytochrome C oxidase subunit II n=1 Tax=Cohnella endophytica TaxID=2419778 RepID=A0A494XW32_9BACL|nr:cupredoxin domain-containing protein [Cohnella endophytica]RKP53894.1 cytochrome C oxidase subunit II [Cohnella endophytica]